MPTPRLSPATREVTLRGSAKATLPYVLDVPARHARPLDVFFLVDTTTWEDAPVFDAVRDGLRDAAALLAKRPGVRLGVGEYRDLGDVEGGEQATYRLRRRLGAPDAALYAAISGLRSSGGGQPDGEAATIALDEALHGDGHLGVVPPGLSAGFRPDRETVVVLVAESAFADVTTLYPDTYAVSHAYRDADIRLVGIAPRTELSGESAVASDLRDVAGWGLGASWRDVECDGEEEHSYENDVQPGGPVVCAPWVDEFAPAETRRRVAALVPHLLDSFGVRASVWANTPEAFQSKWDPDTESYTPSSLTMSPTGQTYFDPSRPYRMRFSIGLTCPKGTRGKDYTIPLGVMFESETTFPNTAKIVLHCR
jgi:hypothetical protein